MATMVMDMLMDRLNLTVGAAAEVDCSLTSVRRQFGHGGEISTKTKVVSPNPNRESTPGIASWMMKT